MPIYCDFSLKFRILRARTRGMDGETEAVRWLVGEGPESWSHQLPASSQGPGDAEVSDAPPPNLTQSSGGVGSIVDRKRIALELTLHAGKRWMLPVLDLDPAIRPAAAVDALAVLGNHTLQSRQAGVPEQVRADLALLEWRFISARSSE